MQDGSAVVAVGQVWTKGLRKSMWPARVSAAAALVRVIHVASLLNAYLGLQARRPVERPSQHHRRRCPAESRCASAELRLCRWRSMNGPTARQTIKRPLCHLKTLPKNDPYPIQMSGCGSFGTDATSAAPVAPDPQQPLASTAINSQLPFPAFA